MHKYKFILELVRNIATARRDRAISNEDKEKQEKYEIILAVIIAAEVLLEDDA